MRQNIILVVFVVGMLSGCATPRSLDVPDVLPKDRVKEDRRGVKVAIESVLGTVSGQDVKVEELKDQLRKDEEARSSVETITETLTGAGVSAKYCPQDGKRYSPKMTICPEHQVELKIIEE